MFAFPIWALYYTKLCSAKVPGWMPFTNCHRFSENSTKISIDFQINRLFGSTLIYEIDLLIEGVLLELIPSIILPITTIGLVKDLKEAQKNSMSIKSSTKSHDTLRSIKLVTFMTISFLFTTTPHGLMYVIGMFNTDKPGLV